MPTQKILIELEGPSESAVGLYPYSELVTVSFLGGGYDEKLLSDLAAELSETLNRVLCESKGDVRPKVVL
jgi:hypothetical protein